MRDLIEIVNSIDEELFPGLSFRNFRNRNSFFTPIEEAKIAYPMDIYNTDDAKIFEIVVLDADKSDINIFTKGPILTVEYNKTSDQSEPTKYEYKRITRRSFTFSWKLPELYCLNETFSTLSDGLLKIIVPRQNNKEIKCKKVDINDGCGTPDTSHIRCESCQNQSKEGPANECV